jgi:hypothetical protein
MLKDATVAAHGGECRAETPAIVPEHLAKSVQLDLRGSSKPISPPPLAGRVRHHWPRPRVLACVPRDVPAVDVWTPRVNAVGKYVEGRDHHPAPRTRNSSPDHARASRRAMVREEREVMA